jgi:uncharacterized membrane protein
MVSFRLKALLVSTISAGLTFTTTLNAAPYDLIDLGTLGGLESYAIGINSANQITGASGGPEIADEDIAEDNPAAQCPLSDGRTFFREFCRHAFLYDNGVMTDLGDLGFFTSFGSALNDNGTVVGHSFIQNDQGDDDDSNDAVEEYAVVSFNGGEVQALPYPAEVIALGDAINRQMRALDITNNDLIVGYMLYPSEGLDVNDAPITVNRIRGYVYDYTNDSFMIVPNFEDDYSLQTGVRAVNEQGIVAGWGVTVEDFEPAHAMVWDSTSGATTSTDIGTLGGYFSYANDINDNNLVVGRSDTTKSFSTNNNLAFYYDLNAATPEMIAIPEFSEDDDFTQSVAYGINNLNQVVGSAQISAGFTPRNTAFLYDIDNDSLINLNDMVDCSLNWELNIARDINDSGVIVGVGTLDGLARSFMLVPTGDTEPTNCTALRQEERDEDRQDAVDDATSGGSMGWLVIMLSAAGLFRRSYVRKH